MLLCYTLKNSQALRNGKQILMVKFFIVILVRGKSKWEFIQNKDERVTSHD